MSEPARSASLITVAEDLAAVTTTGHEDDPAEAGVARAQIEALWESVRAWYRLGTTPAIQVCLRRGGAVVLNRAIGHGWGNAPSDPPDAVKVPATPDTPFCGFSTSKGVTGALFFMLIEQGVFRLDDRVCQYIPEFTGHGKDMITIAHVLSHSAGLPFVPAPYTGLELIVDEELAARTLAAQAPSWPPGRFRLYHALTGGLIQRLLVRNATGKRLREHLAEQVLEPLGFRWTNFGVRPAEVDLVAPSVWTGPAPSLLSTRLARKGLGATMQQTVLDSTTPEFLTAELPSGNLVTTAFELSRFYEILARGGELDGVRIIEPGSLREAVTQVRGVPGLAGRMSRAGFELGARRSPVGRDTRSFFGRSGLTTQYAWADPARGLAGAILTSGKATGDVRRRQLLLTRIADAVDHLAPADRLF